MDKAEIESVLNILEASKKVAGNPKKFVSFMLNRFHLDRKNYTNYGYALEWANRFNSGKPETYMDNKSLRVYQELK